MNSILKLLISIAALMIIAEGAYNAYSIYEYRLERQRWRDTVENGDAGARQPEEPAELRPITTESFVTTSLDYVRLGEASDVELDQNTKLDRFLIVPLVLRNKEDVIAIPATPIAEKKALLVEEFSCKNASFPNVIVADQKKKKAHAIFQEKIAITAIDTVAVSDDGELTLLMSVVRRDSNQDGYFSCHDLEEMAVFKTSEDSVTYIDLDGGEFFGSIILLKDQKVAFTIGNDVNNDGFFDPNSERAEAALLDLDTLMVERLAPTGSFSEAENLIKNLAVQE